MARSLDRHCVTRMSPCSSLLAPWRELRVAEVVLELVEEVPVGEPFRRNHIGPIYPAAAVRCGLTAVGSAGLCISSPCPCADHLPDSLDDLILSKRTDVARLCLSRRLEEAIRALEIDDAMELRRRHGPKAYNKAKSAASHRTRSNEFVAVATRMGRAVTRSCARRKQ